MKDKILYIAFLREDSESIGFVNKVYSQCFALKELSNEVFLIISRAESAVLYKIVKGSLEKVQVCDYREFSKFQSGNLLTRKFKSLIRFQQFIDFAESQRNIINPNKIYIRRVKPLTLKFISFIKNSNNAKVFYEYPDFPDQPWVKQEKNRNIFKKVDYYYEYILTHSLAKYIFKFVMISIDESFPDKKNQLVFLRNGIDIENIKVSKTRIDLNVINFIGVANIGYWHAYDRIIKGLYEYYKSDIVKHKVYFHIVGEGKVKLSLQQLTEKLNLSEYVIFHGVKVGNELNDIFDYSDLGIGILGNHRRSFYGDSSLKNREYCARGIPFVISNPDLDFDEKIFPYFYLTEPNESSINISLLVNFIEDIKSRDKNYKKNMRKYAEDNLTWKEKMSFLNQY